MSDDIAARRGDDGASAPHEERAGQQERGAHARAELRVELGLANLGRMHADLVLAHPLDFDAEIAEQGEHGVDVPDSRDVSEQHGVARQHAGGEDRQGAVLVSGRPHAPVQGLSAFDHEGLHERVFDEGLGHR